MARKKGHVDVLLFRHGIIWWLLFGWWWRPCVYLFWITYNIIFNVEVRFKKEKRR